MTDNQNTRGRDGNWRDAGRAGGWVVSLLASLLALGGPKWAQAESSTSENQDVEALTETILAHVASTLPNATPRSVEAERKRVRTFAALLQKFAVPSPDPAAVRTAAVASIDAARNLKATPDSLVHAAMIGVARFYTSGRLPGSPDPERTHRVGSAAQPSGRLIGTLWVISLPTLNVPEAFAKCPALRRYFDLPAEGVSTIVLDLRGNQGGYVPTAVCAASQFLAPKIALFQLSNRTKKETLESVATGRSAPIAQPLFIWLDTETDSGGLALAMALQDVGRAVLMGESTERPNDKVKAIFPMPGNKEPFALPIGWINRVNGTALGAGVNVNVSVSPTDDAHLLTATCEEVSGCRFPRSEGDASAQSPP